MAKLNGAITRHLASAAAQSDGLHDKAMKLHDDASACRRTGDLDGAMLLFADAAEQEVDAVTQAIHECRLKWATILAVSAAAMYLDAGVSSPPSRWSAISDSLPFTSAQREELHKIWQHLTLHEASDK